MAAAAPEFAGIFLGYRGDRLLADFCLQHEVDAPSVAGVRVVTASPVLFHVLSGLALVGVIQRTGDRLISARLIISQFSSAAMH